MNTIEIWEPRYHDRVALVATRKVTSGVNRIIFTRAKSMPGVYEIDGDEMRRCPVKGNGKIPCYVVPLEKLKRV
jgi:hypothetical protein